MYIALNNKVCSSNNPYMASKDAVEYNERLYDLRDSYDLHGVDFDPRFNQLEGIKWLILAVCGWDLTI